MATLGNTAVGSGWAFTGVNVQNQVAQRLTMPSPGGVVTNLHGYFDVNSGSSITCKLCLWDSSGNLLASVNVTSSAGSHSAGGQSWHTAAISATWIPAGTFYVGWWTPNANGMVWSDCTASTTAYYQNAGASPATVSTSSIVPNNDACAYVDYTPGSLYADDGSAFQAGCLAYVDDGAAWQQCPVYVDDGAAWQLVG